MPRASHDGSAPGRLANGNAGVLVVDDQKIFRDVMRAVVEASPGLGLVGEASCGEDALAAVDELAPDLVIVDVRMPGIGGLELARLLLERAPPPAVVLVSAQLPPTSLPVDRNGSTVLFVAKERLTPAVLLSALNDNGGPLGDLGDPVSAEDAADPGPHS